MNHIDYFKLQAKNLYRDFKTQSTVIEKNGDSYFEYEPKFFDIEMLFGDVEVNEENFSLMKAQHIIAQLVGFTKWTDMVKASAAELELAKLLFDNMHKISAQEWDDYIFDVESNNDLTFDAEGRLEIFQEVFANVDGHQSDYADYRLNQRVKNIEVLRPVAKAPGVQITSLPLSEKDRLEFIKVANRVFDSVAERMEPRNPIQTRELWEAEGYVDSLLTENMLPISRDYALSLIDAFLVHHVANLAAQADKMAMRD